MLKQAEAVLKDKKSTQTQVDEATALLNAAMENLVLKNAQGQNEDTNQQADKTALEKLVERSRSLKPRRLHGRKLDNLPKCVGRSTEAPGR